MRAHDGDVIDDEHYHLFCAACCTPTTLKETQAGVRVPNGEAYRTKEEAEYHASVENEQPFMQNWGEHHLTVMSCHDSICQVQEKSR